jgi:CBS domain-containing protein
MKIEALPLPDREPAAWRTLMAQPVTQMMYTPVPSVSPQTDIRRVANVLMDTGLPGLPVVGDDSDLTGFISRSDILRAVTNDPPLDLWG